MSDDYYQIIAAVCTEPLKAPPQKQAVVLYPNIVDHVLGTDHNVYILSGLEPRNNTGVH